MLNKFGRKKIMVKSALSKVQILNAIKVHKQLPMPMTKLEQTSAETLLKKRLTMEEVLDVIDLVNSPLSQQLSAINQRASLTAIALDKSMQKNGLDEKTIDKIWADAHKELDEANRKASEKMQESFKQQVADLKEGK